MKDKTYCVLAQKVAWRLRVDNDEQRQWFRQAESDIEQIMGTAPSGSGIDSGVSLDLDKSTGERLVFTIPFHRMNEAGFYCGWVDYTMTVKPSLQYGFDSRVTGRDHNGLRDYVDDVMRVWLGGAK